jgi:predicted TIM-barrel fold metal-dependent hydrolase
MTYCIEQFGPDRCMFESNFPVDKISYSYNEEFADLATPPGAEQWTHVTFCGT